MKKSVLYVISIVVLIISGISIFPCLIIFAIAPDIYAIDVTDENREYFEELVRYFTDDCDDVPEMANAKTAECLRLMHKYEITVKFEDESEFTLYIRDSNQNKLVSYIRDNGHDLYLFSTDFFISSAPLVIDAVIFIGCIVYITKCDRELLKKKESENAI